jgi:hypothetical protein
MIARIELLEGRTEIKYSVGSSIKEKSVRTSDLLSSLTNYIGIATPLLPPNTRMVINKKDGITLIIEVPPSIRKLSYIAGSKKIFDRVNFPFPWELWKIELINRPGKGYTFARAYVFALKNPIMTKEDKLYSFPTPNVGGGNGAICFGSAMSSSNMSNIDNLVQAYRFITIFHDAEFNTDLHPSLKNNERFEDLVRRLQDKPTFDYESLLEKSPLYTILEGGTED